jgi:hypothetical protein
MKVLFLPSIGQMSAAKIRRGITFRMEKHRGIRPKATRGPEGKYEGLE